MENSTSLYPITPADPDRHLMAIARITADAFTNGEYTEEIAQNYIGNCHYDWDVTRLIWDGDQLIHHWGVWGYPMRLGSVQLQVAGIGAVATVEKFRKRGLMQQAALASFDAMQQKGYDLSILRGRHYVKFGYARAWNYITYRLKPEEIPAPPLQQPYQKLGTQHIAEMDSIYNETHQAFSGTALRPTYRLKSAEEMSAYGWFDENGKLTGYLRAQPPEDEKENLQCLEVVGDPQQALAVMSELFKQGEYKTMTFFTLPPQHPLLQLLRPRDCIVETRYFATSGWRVRIVNLQSTLEKIRPLLETRLEQSHLADWNGQLALDAGQQKATLGIADGKIQVTENPSAENCIHGGAGIGRLLIGSDEPIEIIQQEKIICSGDAMQLACVLFPNMYPMLSQWDEC
jgi:predicted acetyltransferase